MEKILLCLEWRREGTFKTVNLCITSVIGAVVLICYVMNPEHFFLFLLLIPILLLLFYMVYGRARGRRYRARKLTEQKGEYRLEIKDDVLIYGEKKDRIRLTEGKNQFIFSEEMCVIKTTEKVFAVPVRILLAEDVKLLKEIARVEPNILVHVKMEGVRL